MSGLSVFRHCERSEAIQLSAWSATPGSGLLRRFASRNDDGEGRFMA
jgi:hypothetical protein